MPSNWVLVLVVVAAGVLGGALGAGGAVLLVERGPAGAAGETGEAGLRGPQGPTGPRGPAGDVIAVEGRVADLERAVSDLVDFAESSDLENVSSTVSDLEFELTRLERDVDDICFELDLFC